MPYMCTPRADPASPPLMRAELERYRPELGLGSKLDPRENSSGFDTPLQGWRLKLLPLHACFEFFLQTVSRMHY